jgi:uncharacterized protein
MDTTTRRDFLKQAAAGAALATLAEEVLAQTSGASATGLPTRVLGRTGQRVSILCIGGWHMGTLKDDAEAIRLLQTALDEGITFFDNSWDYHDGRSEELMGRALAEGGRREKVFLMTKNCERDYDGSMRCLEDSLRRLKTDRIDLWQFHEMVYDNDPDWVFDKGGIKAAMDARKTGKVGVLGMKGYGGQGIIAKSGLTAAEAYRYSLSMPVSTQVVGLTTLDQLREAVTLARSFTPLSAAEKSALLARVKDVAGDGRYELFKSTVTFDGAHHRKQHGFAV